MVSFPTQKGMTTLLPGHINLVTTLTAGIVGYKVPLIDQSSLQELNQKKNTVIITGGLAVVEDDVVTLVVEE